MALLTIDSTRSLLRKPDQLCLLGVTSGREFPFATREIGLDLNDAVACFDPDDVVVAVKSRLVGAVGRDWSASPGLVQAIESR